MNIPLMNTQEIKTAIDDYKLIIDTRPTDEFVNGFLKGAVNIILNDNFAARALYFAENHEEIILVVRPKDQKKLNDLLTDGLSAKVIGLHTDGYENWRKNELPTDLIINVDAYELNLDIKHDDKAVVLDVRNKEQYEAEHIVGAVNMPMNDFRDHGKIGMLDENSNLYLHCNGGTRSVLLTSVLKRNGYQNVRNIEGGYKGVLQEGTIPIYSNNKKTQN